MRLLAIVALVAAVGCASPTPAPENPTWYDDVLPILRGNCFSCHGAASNYTRNAAMPTDTTAFRWDICDLGAFPWLNDAKATVAMPPVHVQRLIGGLSRAAAIYDHSIPQDGARPRMPPAPADVLSDRDLDVLENWARVAMDGDAAAACGTRGNANARPRAAFVGRANVDGKLRVTLDVTDDDYDQVLGTLACGDGPATLIPNSGRVAVDVDLTGASPGSELRAVLNDGHGDVLRTRIGRGNSVVRCN